MKILSFLLVLLCAAAGAHAATPATDAVRNGNTRLREMLAKKADPARIVFELRGVLDVEDLGKRALVDHWGEMTRKQQQDLVETLRLVIERNYLTQLRENLEYEIEYSGEEPRGADVLVKTVIKAQRGGRPVSIPVDYLMHAESGGGWRAYDVVTDEVSLLKNYRSQFNRIIAKEGVNGLLKRMKAKLASVGPSGE